MTAPIDRVLAALPQHARRAGDGWSARCPAHGDRRPSLSIRTGEDGRALVKCQAGCSFEAVLQALGLTPAELFPAHNGQDAPERARQPARVSGGPTGGTNGAEALYRAQRGGRRLVATYDYLDRHGRLAYQVVRYEPKNFRQRRPDGAGGWIWNLEDVERIPYRLPDLLAADPDETVYVVEGERDVDALAACGLVATCNSGGAGKWPETFAPHFAGRRVVVLPDHDEAGRKHAEQVRASLATVAGSVRVLELPGLPDKGDVSDWLAAGGDLAQLAQLVDGMDPGADSSPNVPSVGDLASAVRERLGFRLVAEISTDAPPPMLIERLDPSSHTILYGTGGVGKGTLTAWWIVQLVAAGHRVLIVDYENHPDEWSRRIHGLGGDRSAVGWVAPLTAAWRGRLGAIWVQAPELAELARDWGATYLVLDSVVPACGAIDPLKPEAAGQYAGALERIGLPALSLAHVTKSESLSYPFGSVFWHNLARVTWSLKADGEGAAVLAMRKANNYPRATRQRIEALYLNGQLRGLHERAVTVVLAERIDEALGSERLSPAEITNAINEALEDGAEEVKRNSVIGALRRGARMRPPRYDVADGRWWRVIEP